MRNLSRDEVVKLHRLILSQSGGAQGIRDSNALDSAIAQPHMTFDGNELYPSPIEKAAALCHSLVTGHPFVDGNKRVGHAAMEVVLVLSGLEIRSSVDEHERGILEVAAGRLGRRELTA